MAFDQSTISDPRNFRSDTDLVIRWSSSAPLGTVFQAYLNRRLVWHGIEHECTIPWPSGDVPVDIGAVGPGEDSTDFSASLPAIPGGGNRALLAWQGGNWEAMDLAGFHVYSGTVAGGAVSYTTPVATIAAFPQGRVDHGFGEGGFGEGGFGVSGIPLGFGQGGFGGGPFGGDTSNYGWTSGILSAGTWNFAVKPFDLAGNEGTTMTASVVISAPPRPPAADSQGLRLHADLEAGFGLGGFGGGGFGTSDLLLTWRASPP